MSHTRELVPFLILPLVSAALASPVPPVPPEPPENQAATRMWLSGEELERVEVVSDKTLPPHFTLAFVREMPTPGWTCRLDSVTIDAEGQRISARLTEVAPEGITAQVITPTRFEVPIGSVPSGTYFVEIWTRRDPGREHKPVHALVMTAR